MMNETSSLEFAGHSDNTFYTIADRNQSLHIANV